MRTPILIFGMLLACCLSSQVHGQDLMVRSDLPLWTEDLAPQHFTDADGWGCTSRVAMGVWRSLPLPSEPDEEPDHSSFRLRNYGVFHCAYLYEVEGAGGGWKFDSHAWIADAGTVVVGAERRRLLILQIGAMGGSRYLAFTAPDDGKLITSLHQLLLDCPRPNLRDAGSLDVWLTRYCAINDRRLLIRLAKRAAARPPVASFQHEPSTDGGDGDEDGKPAKAAPKTDAGPGAPKGGR